MSKNKLKVAIVGAGPAGMFAAEALTKQKDYDVQVDVFDKRTVPYGLVRFGVAPDHAKIKAVTKRYDKTFADERVRFFGNVNFGHDISLEEARQYYDKVIFSIGAPADFSLGIPGEELDGVVAAREFVGWFNCDPEDAGLKVNLSGKHCYVIGIGNVALDVARIIGRDREELAKTEIADHALSQLRESEITHIHLVARRGPAEAACTHTELKEITGLHNVDVIVDGNDFEGIDLDSLEKENRNMVELLQTFIGKEPEGKPIRLYFDFLTSPVSCSGNGKLEKMTFVKNKLVENDGWLSARPVEGSEYEADADLMLRAIRYAGVEFPGLPFNEKKGIIPNDAGKVEGEEDIYVAGWIKRGATGVIGTNKPDAAETVKTLLANISSPEFKDVSTTAIEDVLKEKGIRRVSSEDWNRINEEELRRGEEQGRDRVRFVFAEDVFAFLDGAGA